MANRTAQIIDDGLDLAIKAGIAKAIAEHKRAGRSIAVWKDGKVVIIPPEAIRVPRARRSGIKRTIE
jgi:predicted RNA methylase